MSAYERCSRCGGDADVDLLECVPCQRKINQRIAALEARVAVVDGLLSERVAALRRERDEARLAEAKRILLNIIRVNGGSPLDEEAVLAAIDVTAKRRAE